MSLVVAQVQVEVEKPGIVWVEAIAPNERANDSRPVAGFFVRRRYQGDRFKLARAEEFSHAWMRFVQAPPESWVPVIEKKIKPHGLTMDDCMWQPNVDLDDAPNPNQPFSMGQLQQAERTTHQLNYGTGKVSPRASK